MEEEYAVDATVDLFLELDRIPYENQNNSFLVSMRSLSSEVILVCCKRLNW